MNPFKETLRDLRKRSRRWGAKVRWSGEQRISCSVAFYPEHLEEARRLPPFEVEGFKFSGWTVWEPETEVGYLQASWVAITEFAISALETKL